MTKMTIKINQKEKMRTHFKAIVRKQKTPNMILGQITSKDLVDFIGYPVEVKVIQKLEVD